NSPLLWSQHRPADSVTVAQIIERCIGFSKRAFAAGDGPDAAVSGEPHKLACLGKGTGIGAEYPELAQREHRNRQAEAPAHEPDHHNRAAFAHDALRESERQFRAGKIDRGVGGAYAGEDRLASSG